MLGTYVRFRVRICFQPSETRESNNTLRDSGQSQPVLVIVSLVYETVATR
jgi:hypothetical protein